MRTVRLDAIGYAIKKAGTSCFMIPETFAFIADLSRRVRALGMEGFVEIHSHYRKQIEIADARRLGLRLRAAAARATCVRVSHRAAAQGLARAFARAMR